MREKPCKFKNHLCDQTVYDAQFLSLKLVSGYSSLSCGRISTSTLPSSQAFVSYVDPTQCVASSPDSVFSETSLLVKLRFPQNLSSIYLHCQKLSTLVNYCFLFSRSFLTT